MSVVNLKQSKYSVPVTGSKRGKMSVTKPRDQIALGFGFASDGRA